MITILYIIIINVNLCSDLRLVILIHCMLIRSYHPHGCESFYVYLIYNIVILILKFNLICFPPTKDDISILYFVFKLYISFSPP